jgi:hypothetical protein
LEALPSPNADGECRIVLRPPKADDKQHQLSDNDRSNNNPALDAGSRATITGPQQDLNLGIQTSSTASPHLR